MAERAAVRQAIETLEIQQSVQLDNLDKHCHNILKHSHPDKLAEAKRMEHTEYTGLFGIQSIGQGKPATRNGDPTSQERASIDSQSANLSRATHLSLHAASKGRARKLSRPTHRVGIMVGRGHTTHILSEPWNQTAAMGLAHQQDDRLSGNRIQL